MTKVSYCALIYALFLILTSCSENFQKFSGFTWGTTYSIIYRGDSSLGDSIAPVMNEIDASLSMFNPASTVSHINAGSDYTADVHLRRMLELSRKVQEVSSGAFDPTVGPLVELWGFGTSGEQSEPDSAAVAAALEHVGVHRLRLDGERVVFEADSMRLDFSAIAKGYGVDLVADMLRRNGCRDFLVEIGGEISASGHNAEGKPWRIQIDAPTTDDDGRIVHDRMRIIELSDAAIATSGNYRNYRDFASGRRAGHTISPITGYPVESSTLSVSVVAPDCATADALATAAMAMPYSEARSMIEALEGVDALFVLSDSKGSLIVEATPGFPD